MQRIREAIHRHSGPVPIEPSAPFTRASVAMVLRQAAAGPELLMIKRAEHESDPWSGHMAFPGGRTDPEDADPCSTARREAREELGLELGGALHLGELSPLTTPFRARGKVHYVHAHVFGVERVPPLTPNYEVASVHWFGLERLLAGEGRDTFEYTLRGQAWPLPCVRLDECFIWGMSLRMIDDLLERLRAP
jgi:8-oxo-dGTP pyrophosphatase MutT (NUDIX family)